MHELKKLLQKQHYAFVGKHSAIKICEWTKRSLRNNECCYKEKFYGIKSHRCCQITPSVGFCTNNCIFCWRPIEYSKGTKMQDYDDPKEIIKNAIEAQKKLLIGFKGSKADQEKLKEAFKPNQFAISLSGEPTLYPKLPELIKEIKKLKATSFLVTNGLQPEVLIKLKECLPTNLYLSIDAPNEEIFKKVDRPKTKDAWKKLNKSLEIFKELKTTKVLRITLIKNLNMINPEQYANLIEKADPEFVEVKAYMWVGFSRERLEKTNMPLHKEVKEFTNKILKHLKNYKLENEKKESRVVLLKKLKGTPVAD